MSKTSVDLFRYLRSFTDRKLAWDLHCFSSANEILCAIQDEADQRGIDLCRIPQERAGGPFTDGSRWWRPACGGCWRSRLTRNAEVIHAAD